MAGLSRGSYYAAAAFCIWGLFPIYFKWLAEVPALLVLSHRIVWSCLVLCTVLLARRRWPTLVAAARQRKVLLAYGGAAVVVAVNWLGFIWSVNTGQIVAASLGYFINPLLSLILGMVILGERLRPWQWPPVALVATGVLYLAFALGDPPWIGLMLGSTFALYGLVKKIAPLDSFTGLTLETVLLTPAALAYLIYADVVPNASLLHRGGVVDGLLVGSGVAMTVPMLLFAAAARRITLTQLGIMQYIAPTITLLLGVLVYGEAFPLQRALGYTFIWVALLLFTLEGYLAQRQAVIA